MRDKQTTSKIMSSIKSKNTKPEKLLASAMWQLGLRYRKQYRIVGKPDFAFIGPQIAVFCDGDFWHGNNWRLRGFMSPEDELATYSEYWRTKVKNNKARDILITNELIKMGWIVIRFWESDIRKSPDDCAKQVYIIYKRQSVFEAHYENN